MATYDLVGKVMIWKPTLDTTGTVTTTAEENMKAHGTTHVLYGDVTSKMGKNSSTTPGSGSFVVDASTSPYATSNSSWTKALKENNINEIINILNVHNTSVSLRNSIRNLEDNTISGWHAMKLCNLFGVTYADNNNTKLKEIDIRTLLGIIPIDQLKIIDSNVDGTSYVNVLFTLTTVMMFINMCVRKLNEAGLEQITFEKMSTDGSLGQEIVGGSIEPATPEMEAIQKILDGYRYDLKNYMVGGTPAHFDMGEDMFGGVDVKNEMMPLSDNQLTSFQAKDVYKGSDKSSHYFEKLFENIQKALRDNKRELAPSAITAINDNLKKLREAENVLMKALDSSVIGLTVGKPNLVLPEATGAQRVEYKKLFDTVDAIGRRESRIISALSQLIGYLVPVTPTAIGLRVRGLGLI